MARSEGMGAMTRERMQALLDAYGANALRWPEAEREGAQAWAAAHAEAFAAMAREAEALDAALAFDVRDSADDETLAQRVLAMRDGNVVAVDFGRGRVANDWRRPAAALAACAVLGLAIGFTGAPRHDDIAMDLDAAFGAAFDMHAYGDGAGG
jgi:hypothetical protein